MAAIACYYCRYPTLAHGIDNFTAFDHIFVINNRIYGKIRLYSGSIANVSDAVQVVERKVDT